MTRCWRYSPRRRRRMPRGGVIRRVRATRCSRRTGTATVIEGLTEVAAAAGRTGGAGRRHPPNLAPGVDERLVERASRAMLAQSAVGSYDGRPDEHVPLAGRVLARPKPPETTFLRAWPGHDEGARLRDVCTWRAERPWWRRSRACAHPDPRRAAPRGAGLARRRGGRGAGAVCRRARRSRRHVGQRSVGGKARAAVVAGAARSLTTLTPSPANPS